MLIEHIGKKKKKREKVEETSPHYSPLNRPLKPSTRFSREARERTVREKSGGPLCCNFRRALVCLAHRSIFAGAAAVAISSRSETAGDVSSGRPAVTGSRWYCPRSSTPRNTCRTRMTRTRSRPCPRRTARSLCPSTTRILAPGILRTRRTLHGCRTRPTVI